MKLVWQPEGTNMCGQACMAMLTDQSLEQVVHTLRRGKTRTKTLVGYMRDHALKCGWRLRRMTDSFPVELELEAADAALVKITWEPGKCHWVIFCMEDGLVYDPALFEPRKGFFGRPTSYLPVWFPKGTGMRHGSASKS
jgi:hypothetical protein